MGPTNGSPNSMPPGPDNPPPATLMQAKPKRKSSPTIRGQTGLAGPPCEHRTKWPLHKKWDQVGPLVDDIPWDRTIRPSIQGKGECLGLRSLGEGHTIAGDTQAKVDLVNRLNWLLRSESKRHNGQMVWTSWQVNVDTTSRPHTDSGNLGRSFITALGSFSGGEFLIQGSAINLRGNGVWFHGSNPHSNAGYEGHRVSIIAFCHGAATEHDGTERRTLASMGFPIENWDPRRVPKPKKGAFLDIFAGPRSPLSRALLRIGKMVMTPIDSDPNQMGHWGDLLDDALFERLFRLAWPGKIAVLHMGPPCSAFFPSFGYDQEVHRPCDRPITWKACLD